jgi:hypothetical protein
MLGHQFYDIDEDNFPLELDPVYGTDMAQRYNVKVAKLAWEIAGILKLLEKNEAEARPAATVESLPAKPTVYLAECSFEQRDAREALDAELRCHGYRVLPDSQLPREESAFVKEVENQLQQSRLSVHLIGGSYGAVPDGPSQKSIAVLQNELATQASHKTGLRRIIWLPDGTVARHTQQELFIRELRSDPEAQFGADLITSDRQESIKGAIHEALLKIQAKPAKSSEHADSERKLIYLICDVRDRRNTLALRRMLLARGFDVQIPIFEGDAATVRQANQDILAQCSGVLIYFGDGGEAWKRSVDSDLRKLLGSRRAGAKLPIRTCIAAPETEAKRELLELDQGDVLNCLEGISEQELLPFLSAMEEGES